MIALYDHIQELRAELRGCIMTCRERAAVEAELVAAIAALQEHEGTVEARRQGEGGGACASFSMPGRSAGNRCQIASMSFAPANGAILGSVD
jgi:hypothetical protein